MSYHFGLEMRYKTEWKKERKKETKRAKRNSTQKHTKPGKKINDSHFRNDS